LKATTPTRLVALMAHSSWATHSGPMSWAASWTVVAGPGRKRCRYENHCPRHTAPRFEPHPNLPLSPNHHHDTSSFITLPRRRIHRTPPPHLYLGDSSSRPLPPQHVVDPRHPLLHLGFVLIQRTKGHIFFLFFGPFHRIPSIHRS
jgi:hypothetical protein